MFNVSLIVQCSIYILDIFETRFPTFAAASCFVLARLPYDVVALADVHKLHSVRSVTVRCAHSF